MIEEVFYEEQIPSYKGFNKEELKTFFDSIIEKLENSKLKNPVVEFSSQIDLDDTSSVWLRFSGERELTKEELAMQDRQKLIEKLAKKLGVTFYEASVVYRLKEQNKL